MPIKQITSSRVQPSRAGMKEGEWRMALTGGKVARLFHKFSGILWEWPSWAGLPSGYHEGDVLTIKATGDLVWRSGAFEKALTFDSPAGSSGTFYFGGHYDFAASNNDFSPSTTHGTANASHAAHFFVVLGASTVDELTITVTGTSITDSATRTTSDTDTIVIPSGTSANAYYETDKKWIGQVTIEATAGTAKDCNYGFAKYWDNHNKDFKVVGIEVTWLGGANDASPNIKLRHHSATGWTYNAGSTPTPPTEIAAMATDHSTEDEVVNGENGAWKREDLDTTVQGSVSEGTIMEVVTTQNKTFELGNILIRLKPV